MIPVVFLLLPALFELLRPVIVRISVNHQIMLEVSLIVPTDEQVPDVLM